MIVATAASAVRGNELKTLVLNSELYCKEQP